MSDSMSVFYSSHTLQFGHVPILYIHLRRLAEESAQANETSSPVANEQIWTPHISTQALRKNCGENMTASNPILVYPQKPPTLNLELATLNTHHTEKRRTAHSAFHSLRLSRSSNMFVTEGLGAMWGWALKRNLLKIKNQGSRLLYNSSL